jgi:nucleotide-binding universal stress UspA family protein
MYKRILVATDGSTLGGKAVKTAADLALKLDAAVNLVTIMGQGDVPGSMVKMLKVEHLIKEESTSEVPLGGLSRIPVPAVRADLRAVQAAKVHQVMAKKILDDASRKLKSAGLTHVDTHLEHGNPARVILELAKQSGSDLIVVGSRGFGDLKSLFLGSVSHKVLQLAECPCLIVK